MKSLKNISEGIFTDQDDRVVIGAVKPVILSFLSIAAPTLNQNNITIGTEEDGIIPVIFNGNWLLRIDNETRLGTTIKSHYPPFHGLDMRWAALRYRETISMFNENVFGSYLHIRYADISCKHLANVHFEFETSRKDDERQEFSGIETVTNVIFGETPQYVVFRNDVAPVFKNVKFSSFLSIADIEVENIRSTHFIKRFSILFDWSNPFVTNEGDSLDDFFTLHNALQRHQFNDYYKQFAHVYAINKSITAKKLGLDIDVNNIVIEDGSSYIILNKDLKNIVKYANTILRNYKRSKYRLMHISSKDFANKQTGDGYYVFIH